MEITSMTINKFFFKENFYKKKSSNNIIHPLVLNNQDHSERLKHWLLMGMALLTCGFTLHFSNGTSLSLISKLSKAMGDSNEVVWRWRLGVLRIELVADDPTMTSDRLHLYVHMNQKENNLLTTDLVLCHGSNSPQQATLQLQLCVCHNWSSRSCSLSILCNGKEKPTSITSTLTLK